MHDVPHYLMPLQRNAERDKDRLEKAERLKEERKVLSLRAMSVSPPKQRAPRRLQKIKSGMWE